MYRNFLLLYFINYVTNIQKTNTWKKSTTVLYNIHINQFAILQHKINLDIIDVAILQAISYLINTTPKDNPISYDSIIELLPILKITNKRTIQRRIKTLVDEWMIEKEVKNNNETYFKFWQHYHFITF